MTKFVLLYDATAVSMPETEEEPQQEKKTS